MQKHNLLHFRELSSTNETLKQLIREGKITKNYSSVYTDYQTHGRGQAQSSWTSLPAQNLLSSVAFFPSNLRADEQFRLSISVALAIRDYLQALISTKRVLIKWPNDIYIDDRKICGILIEQYISSNLISSSIIGIGLNVNQKVFPSELPNPTSIQLLRPSESPYIISEILQGILESLEKRLENIQSQSLTQEYLSNLYLYKTPAYYIANNQTFLGCIRGVSPLGELILENLDNGTLSKYFLKEIRLLGKAKN